MKNLPTEEQFLIYARGPKNARPFIENNWPDHYRETFKKSQNGSTLVWNWAAFFAGPFWFIRKGMPLAFFTSYIFIIAFSILTFKLLGLYNIPSSWLFWALMIGLYGEKLLMKRFLKHTQKVKFQELSHATRTTFLAKVGLTEQQYLGCLYGQKDADLLLQYDVPNHYRQAFAKFALEKAIVWNWAASSMVLWLSYRKALSYALLMGLFTVIAFIIPSLNLFAAQLELSSFISTLTLPISTESLAKTQELESAALKAMMLLSLCGLVSMILAMLFSNRLLLHYFAKQVRQGNLAFFSKKSPDLVLPLFMLGCFSLVHSFAPLNPNLPVTAWELVITQLAPLVPLILAIAYRRYQMKNDKNAITKV